MLCASPLMARGRFVRTFLNVLLAKNLCPASLDAEELRRAGGLVGGDGLQHPPVHFLDYDALR